MPTLSTHVLDTARGHPAEGLRVSLFRHPGGELLTERRTDTDGRIRDIYIAAEPGVHADYRLVFQVEEYFERTGVKEYFYPEVLIAFRLGDASEHHHVPLLLNPFGFSTYRGS